MSTRSWVIALAFSMVGLTGARATPSLLSDVSTPTLAPTNVRDIPTWIQGDLAGQNSFTGAMPGDNRFETGHIEQAALVPQLPTAPPEQENSETRVPEPATLIFVGTGLVGIAKFARRARPEWRLRQAAVRVNSSAVQEF